MLSEGFEVKIVDFGVSKSTDRENHGLRGNTLLHGTREHQKTRTYMTERVLMCVLLLFFIKCGAERFRTTI